MPDSISTYFLQSAETESLTGMPKKYGPTNETEDLSAMPAWKDSTSAHQFYDQARTERQINWADSVMGRSSRKDWAGSVEEKEALPAKKAFKSGSLNMSMTPTVEVHTAPKVWTDNPLNTTLGFVTTILFLLIFRNLLNIIPHLLDCINRWKGNTDIEASVQLSRDRNLIALTCFLPITLIASGLGLYSPSFMDYFQGGWMTVATAGVLMAYILLRDLLSWQFVPKNRGKEAYKVAWMSERNFFIISTLMLILSIGVTSLFGADRHTAKMLNLYVLAAIYCLFLFRKSQILLSSCNPLVTILYLCILEIFPTGILVATGTLL